jgi:hypothetical protein
MPFNIPKLSWLCLLMFVYSSAQAQLVRLEPSVGPLAESVSPQGNFDYFSFLSELKGSEVVTTTGGFPVTNASDYATLTAILGYMPYFGRVPQPRFRQEVVNSNPLILGPQIIDDVNPIRIVFDQPVTAVSLRLVHSFDDEDTSITRGDIDLFAFGAGNQFLGYLPSTATSESYTDPLTWEPMIFETADLTSSIKSVVIVRRGNDLEADWGIGPTVQFQRFAVPVPEPSTYGIVAGLGLCLLGLRKGMRRRESPSP